MGYQRQSTRLIDLRIDRADLLYLALSRLQGLVGGAHAAQDHIHRLAKGIERRLELEQVGRQRL